MSIAKDSDEDVFEIIDFTTASEWERFTALLEEILHDWQLTGNETNEYKQDMESTNKGEWQEISASLKFADVPFTLTHHFKTFDTSAEEIKIDKFKEKNNEDEVTFPQYVSDMFKFENDFPGKAHCLVRWYGLQQFITLSSVNPLQSITSASKCKLLLSSLNMAANNTSCYIPMFVQTMNLSDKVFLGVAYGDGLRTDFEMAYVKVPPAQCTHLSGILDVFKSKVGITLSSEPVTVSVRFTYILSDWPHTLWTQLPPDLDATLSDVGFSELGKLPFGALSDPICELQLSTTWPCFSEHSIVDTDIQSDLRPSSAPIWSARLGSSPPPPCLLSEYLAEFLQICSCNQTIVQILGHDFDPTLDDNIDMMSALDRLTNSPVPTLSSVISRARYSHKNTEKNIQGPLSEDILSLLLNFLFPDAQSLQEESAEYPEISSFSQIPYWNPETETLPNEHPLKDILRSMKTSQVDSFVWRLTIIICHVTHSFGGLPAVTHLYYEILRELRFRWDNGILVPGLSEGAPDMSLCLIYQKLQMLNCCVKHRNNRESGSSGTFDDKMEEEEEDEFFECDEVNQDSSSSKDYFSSWDKPEGRLKKCGNLKLLKRKDFLYVPITQEAAPFTEDKLDEQTDELMRLGTDSVGSSQRARFMSSSLLSDMESFKAANPGSILEDFVRWYSPRDWIEEELTNDEGEKTVQRGLSSRMLIQGNLWQEVWDSANPVPARRQKRLFDDTREAENVLHWFNLLSPGTLCLHLLPVVVHASLCRLAEEPVIYTLPATNTELLPHPHHHNALSAQLELVAQRGIRLCRQPPSASNYKILFEQIGSIERCIARAQSLRLKLLGHNKISPESFKPFSVSNLSEDNKEAEHQSSNLEKLPPLERLVVQLLQNLDVVLDDGPKGAQAAAIKRLFAEAKDALFVEEPVVAPEIVKPNTGPEKWDYRNRETSRDIELGKPAGREYLLRAHAAFPADHSRIMPHRLYAVILKNSFRMAGAITQDILFC